MVNTEHESNGDGLPQTWLGMSMATLMLLLLAGVLQALALAWPFEGSIKGDPMGWLQFVGLVVLAAVVDRSRSARQAAWQGWWFAWAWLLASTWWLFISLHVYGGMHEVMAALAVMLLNAFVALFYAGLIPWLHAWLSRLLSRGLLSRWWWLACYCWLIDG